MEHLVQQLSQLASNADIAARAQMSSKLRELATSIESPRETILRCTYMYAQAAVNQTANDLGVFKILSEADGPMGIDDIASKCGADSLLTGRVLRLLAATHLVTEAEQNTFEGNGATKALASPEGSGGIAHGFHFLNKCLQELPAFLQAKNYQSPNNALETPFHAAFHTDQHAFLWVQTQPFILGNFLASLPSVAGITVWTSTVQLAERIRDSAPETPLFVDVGGGAGAQCVAFRAATKGIAGRVILQDLPETLNHAPSYEGVEKMAQNFFEGQPIQNAAFYYLRNVLHDYPDERCLQILRHQIGAMGQKSILLIDELVLPNKGASGMAAQMDITMMATLGSIERTEAQWRSLLDRAGLEIIKIEQYDSEMGYSVIEAATSTHA